nr:hypothetical protein [Terracoccus luteus]
MAASRSVCSETSTGTNRSGRPCSAKASSSVRALSLVPLPGSTTVVASQAATMSSACACRMLRSLSFG